MRRYLGPLLALTLSAAAEAEEGLAVGRVVVGLAVAPPELTTPRSVLGLRGDYHLIEHLGVSGGATWVSHPGAHALSIGAGPVLVFQPGTWTRLTVRLQADWLSTWQRVDGAYRADLALTAAAGLEYLVVWGIGFSAEVVVSLPVGLGGTSRAPPVGQVLLGLFTEL